MVWAGRSASFPPPLLKHFTSPKYAGLLEYGGTFGGAYLLRRGMFMPWELPEILDPDLVREGWARLNTLAALNATASLSPLRLDWGEGGRSPDEPQLSTATPIADVGVNPQPSTTPVRLRVSALELSWYMRNQLLRDSDWAGMAHSLEIRVPLVDVTLLRALAPLLAGATPPTKLDMASAPISPLPAAVLNRPKTGFQIPVREWLLEEKQKAESRKQKWENGNQQSAERGLRGWAKLVYARFPGACPLEPRARRRPHGTHLSEHTFGRSPCPPTESPKPIRVLMLLSDGFGGFGGIAKFNRDFMTALCSHDRVSEVIAVPRLMPHDPGKLPRKLRYVTESLGGKWHYVRALRRISAQLRDPGKPPEVIICGHINLLPSALLARRICKAKSVYLIIHGVDAWQPTRSLIVNVCVRRIDGFISVSDVTRQRFSRWAKLSADQGMVLPNCVELSAFRPGPKPPA